METASVRGFGRGVVRRTGLAAPKVRKSRAVQQLTRSEWRTGLVGAMRRFSDYRALSTGAAYCTVSLDYSNVVGPSAKCEASTALPSRAAKKSQD